MLDKEYDILIKNLLEKCYEIEFSDIPPENEIEYEFSEKFNNDMNKLIKRVGKPYFRLINTTAKKIAVIAACIALLAVSLLSVSAVREKLVEFFYEVFDTHTLVIVDEDSQNDQIKTYYTISNIPKDYVLAYENNDVIIWGLVWECPDKKSIIFDQVLSKDFLGLNSEDAEVEEVMVNETPCLQMKQERNYIYYWEFDGYSFSLTYDVSLGEEFAQQVIGKLVEYKK